MIFTFNSGKQYRKFRITCQVSEGKVLKVDVRFVSGERKLGPHRHHWKMSTSALMSRFRQNIILDFQGSSGSIGVAKAYRRITPTKTRLN